MSWERLRVFAAVAEHVSITAAAEALHLTRPAVSQHVRKLEREIDCRLVEPDGRGIRLTAAGHVLAAAARTASTAVRDAERGLADFHEQLIGPLRVGAVPSALRSFVHDALRALTGQHPRVSPSVRDGEVIELIPALRAGRLDAVVLESWTSLPARMPPGVALTELLAEDVQLAVPDGHPLAQRPAVHLGELRGQRWASSPPGTEAHEALVQTLRAHSIDAEVPYCATDYATQLSAVAAGLAVALIPRIARTPCPPGVRHVPCTPALTRTIAVATAENASAPAVEFVAALRRGTRER